MNIHRTFVGAKSTRDTSPVILLSEILCNDFKSQNALSYTEAKYGENYI